MADLLQVFLLAMTPIGELRLAIPVGLLVLQLDVISVFIVAVLGNMIPVVLILLFYEKLVSQHISKIPFFHNGILWWQNKTRARHSAVIEKYGALGLMLFVAVPLPLTGAWTGALLAILMSLPFRKALTSIFGGVIIAGCLVVLAVLAGVNIQDNVGWQVLVAIIMLAALIYFYFKKYKKYE